jgi:glycosyltransferase involved in cell wall biosynthesis
MTTGYKNSGDDVPGTQLKSLTMAPELTILMPCLNESETITTCVEKAKGFLSRAECDGEVLVADNGSVDGSIALAEAAGARVVSVADKGYGAALMGGIKASRGRYIIMGDADNSYDFSKLDAFLRELRAGNSFVIGNRFRGGIEPGSMPFLHRYFGNPALSFLGRNLFSIPISDFHCGLRGFEKKAIDALELETTGMEFASEMIVKSGLKQLKIAEVPTTLKPDGRSRAPHLKTWRDGWRHLKFLLIYSPKWLFFYPGLFLAASGVVLSSLLMSGPLHIGTGLVLDINSFLAACLMTIIGFQILTFGVLARFYATTKGILPRGPRSDLIVKFCTTDYIALIALGLVMLGIVLFGSSLYVWAKVNFGQLINPIVPRLVAAGLSLTAVGFQLGFASFLFGILSIPTRETK